MSDSLELIGLVQQMDDSPRCIRSIRIKTTQTRAKRDQDLASEAAITRDSSSY